MPAPTQTLTPSQQHAANAKAGASAGAKQRRRERGEQDAAITATLAAEHKGRGVWTYTYRANGEARIGTVVEHARREADARTLLGACNEAARLAAGRLRSRHGIPPLSTDERADLAAELAARLISEAGPGRLPARDRLTRSYLVTRAAGIVLDDPDRRADGEMPDDPAAMLAASEASARDKHAAPDPMLNPGVDGTWPEIRIGCAACELPAKPSRAAAYIVAGGNVAGDWAANWNTSDGYAKTRIVPEGTATLRDLLADPDQAADLAGAIAAARLPDRLDRREIRRASIERGLAARPERPRAVPERRWRDEPDEPAPVTVRMDRRIIVSSDRTRAKMAKRGGWTTPRP